ncbi:MAG: hypothetical protein ABI120_02290, partial [Gemmatimonadaceae bacterium]
NLSPKLSVYAAARAFGGTWGSISDPAAFEWVIDGEPVGSGPFLMFDYPALGQHVATVIVQWKTERVSASVNFEVTSELLAEADQHSIELKEFLSNRQTAQ